MFGKKVKQIISLVLAIIMIAMTTIPSFATTQNQCTQIESIDIPIISSLWNKIVEIFNNFIEFIRNIVNPQEPPEEENDNPVENPKEENDNPMENPEEGENNNPEVEIPEGKIVITWKYINYENSSKLEWIERTDYYEYGEEIVPPKIPTDKPSYSSSNEYELSFMIAYYFEDWNAEIQTIATENAKYEAEYMIVC